MDFNSLDKLRENGFEGFKKISALMENSCSDVPSIKGIYLVLFDGAKPVFLPKSTGGYFKGINPTVSVNKLENNWVENTIVLYIGQTGSGTSKKTLNDRIRQYMQFGQGKTVGYKGGRYIWQVANSSDFLICWKMLPDSNPRDIEKTLLAEFKIHYGKLPFANLQG
jgi:hypothetical protein